MPKASGYIRFVGKGYGAVAFAETIEYPRRNICFIEMNPANQVYLASWVDGTYYKPPKMWKMERNVVYPFTLEYKPGGIVMARVGGVELTPLPAPKVERPFKTFGDVEYYPNWWDVPEYRNTAIGAGAGAAIGAIAGYFIKPLGPVVSEAVLALIGGLGGGAAGYLTAKP